MCPAWPNFSKQAMQEMQGTMSSGRPARAFSAQSGSARWARTEPAKSRIPFRSSFSA